jgi:hypothetical protein
VFDDLGFECVMCCEREHLGVWRRDQASLCVPLVLDADEVSSPRHLVECWVIKLVHELCSSQPRHSYQVLAIKSNYNPKLPTCPRIIHVVIIQRKITLVHVQHEQENHKLQPLAQGNIGPHVRTCRRARTRTCALLSPNFVPMTDNLPVSQSR